MKQIIFIGFLIFGFLTAWAWAESIKLAMKNFQINFLNAMEEIMEREAVIYLNELLDEFSTQSQYKDYEREINEARDVKPLEGKIVLVKQLIDLDHLDIESEKHFYMLRNANFFKKMKQQLKRLEAESYEELRDIRTYRMCKQFKTMREEKSRTNSRYSPYSVNTKLVPFDEENIGKALDQLHAKENHTISVDIKSFGERLYEQVKDEGAEIINDYLRSVRKLLQDVIDEKSENEQHSEKLSKILQELDAILNIKDFYEKRITLYNYLEHGLIDDYEQFNLTENSQKDMAEIFVKLKSKGLDLFVTFLFSNFQFLEHLHSEWQKLLPQAPHSLYDNQTKHLHEISEKYKEFKKGHETEDKYEHYIKHVKDLYSKINTNKNEYDQSHVFELLHNASMNLGSVTMNMIRGKCDEF